MAAMASRSSWVLIAPSFLFTALLACMLRGCMPLAGQTPDGRFGSFVLECGVRLA
jgi:hypothetical protein